MGYHKRYTGSDIPSWAVVAIDDDGGRVHGYSKSEAEADQFLQSSARDDLSREFLRRQNGNRGTLTAEEARKRMAEWKAHYATCQSCQKPDGTFETLCDFGRQFWKPREEKKDIVVASGQSYEDADMRDARQHMRRMEKFTKLYDSFLLDRTPAGKGPLFMHVTWEQFSTMQREYQDAVASNDGSHRHFPFQPLASYINKLIKDRPDGTVRRVRDIFVNECGVYTNAAGVLRFVILKDQGPGDLGGKIVSVPDNITRE